MTDISSIISIVNAVGLVFGGIYLAFNRIAVEKRHEVDQLDTRTIQNLQANMAALELKIKLLEEKLNQAKSDHTTSMTEIARLTTENNTMRNVLAGRDAVTKDFYEKSLNNIARANTAFDKFDVFLVNFDKHIGNFDIHTKADEERFLSISDKLKAIEGILAK